jgi:hypothetical protein
MLAEPVTEPPTGILGEDRLVVITGVALPTTRDLHELIAALLFGSLL